MARRSRSHNEPRALTAAATRIKLSDKRIAKQQAARRQAWQEDAWEYFDLVGFVKQSLWLLGNSMAKTRLFVAIENPNDPDGDPIPVTDPASGVPPAVAAQAVAELARLKGPTGGISEILRELDMNLEVAGEGYLIGLAAREEETDPRTGKVTVEAREETWTIRSTSEVTVNGQGVYKVADEPGVSANKQITLTEDDTAIRFWLPHPRYSNLPDSAIRGELEDLETLLILSRQRRAEGRSRLPSGLLLIASDVTAHSPVPTQQQSGRESSGDPVLDKISDAIADAIEDESSAAGLAPIALRVPVAPNEDIRSKVAKIDLSRTSDQWLDNRIDKLVTSVARGLNLPVESVEGHQQTTFANAEQIDEDKFYDHLEPRLLLIVDLLSSAFLRPQLTADDINDQPAPSEFLEWAPKLFIWYDPSALLSKPDTGANADGAYDRNEISGMAYRAAKGYSEDDAPDALELLIRAGLRRGQLSSELTQGLLELLGEDFEVPAPAPGAAPMEADAEASVALLARLLLLRDQQRAQASERAPIAAASRALPRAVIAAVVAPDANPGRQLMDLDRELRSRLIMLADTSMKQAIKTAGNRARQGISEARALVHRTPAEHVLRTLGPGIVAAAGVTDDQLLVDAFGDLEAPFMSLGETAQAEALELASTLGTGFSVSQREAYALRQADDLAEAWAWLREQLVTLASVRMFEPAVDALPPGENDPLTTVPASMIRQAVTRAGGTIGVQTSGAGDAWVTLADGGARPAGGIGTGELIREALGAGGMNVEAYRWVYGPAMRQHPFEEHLALDGLVFQNFDDDSLSATDSWTQFGFYFPGDHQGCVCDVEPIVVAADDLT